MAAGLQYRTWIMVIGLVRVCPCYTSISNRSRRPVSTFRAADQGAARESPPWACDGGDPAAQTRNFRRIRRSAGCSNETIRLFLARSLSPVPSEDRFERIDEEAELEVAWVDLDEAVAMI